MRWSRENLQFGNSGRNSVGGWILVYGVSTNVLGMAGCLV